MVRLTGKYWNSMYASHNANGHTGKTIAHIALNNILTGTQTILTHQPPALHCRNAESALRNGEFMTDAVASWVTNKFVAGPFKNPPLPNFRTNMLMAKEEKTKIRPILNLSAPKGASFNEAIDPYSLHKLTMTFPLLFSQALLQFGIGARFGKMDIENAYKLIPVHPDDWHYYGFKWGGMHFFEQATAFGNSAARAQFDSVAETVVTIAQTLSTTPPPPPRQFGAG
jgi:hypothetical protein